MILTLVVSCLDIYAQVGSNVPLVISNLKTCINGDKGSAEAQSFVEVGLTNLPTCDSLNDNVLSKLVIYSLRPNSLFILF
ncbi:hypothetical protein ACS0TY_009638 [Phlomoides rotata]